MLDKIHNIKDRFVNGGDIVTTFLRSSISSQIASWIDMGASFLLFALCHLAPWISTAIGAVAGGVVNCCINYRFTFHATTLPVKAVAMKYSLIWLGSLLLNVYGTQIVFQLLENVTWLEDMGFKPNGYFAAARLSVSLAVSIFWNFLLQKNFVYCTTRFDPYAIRIVNTLFPHLNRKKRK
ncbi:MAG: GtrA family protein [Duncaniella sp.]|nr:GtrA family protein [Duncaniella sp.]